MPTIVNLMQQFPHLYELLDREEVAPSDIMALQYCLNLTSSPVIEQLKAINTPQSLAAANYLTLIRELYDCINDNKCQVEQLHNIKQRFEQLNPFPSKTKNICIHTINGFITLISHFPNLRSSCITTNSNELFFSIVRHKYPRATEKQFCQMGLLTFFIYCILHAPDDVRGFSLPDIPLTDHYNGMSGKVTKIPDFSPYCSPNSQLKGFEKELEKINQQIANYARKSTLRLDTCAPKRIFLCCPVPNCKKLKPYLVKGCFKNHLINKHKYDQKAAAEEVKNMECQEFLRQMQRDVELRKVTMSHGEEDQYKDSQSENATTNNSIEELKHKPNELRSVFKDKISVIHSRPQGIISSTQNLMKIGNKLYHIVLMDLETTGVNVNTNTIIQIAFLSLSTHQLHSMFVQPEPNANWHQKAATMHQDKLAILAKSDFLRNVIPDVVNYLTYGEAADVIFLVHSWSLDEQFFTKALTSLSHQPKINFHYCRTMEKVLLGRVALEKQYSSRISNDLPGTPENQKKCNKKHLIQNHNLLQPCPRMPTNTVQEFRALQQEKHRLVLDVLINPYVQAEP